MAYLKVGEAIPTKDFKKVVILPNPNKPNETDPKLAEGGQGKVYLVEYNGKKKALKWYSGKKIANPKKFIENLENNIKLGSPNSAFIWPEAITEKKGEAFGYVMELFPGEDKDKLKYEDFARFLIGKVKFSSMSAITRTSMHLAAAFRALHQKGYSYQDLNDGNFIIHPKTGKVLICDNDNVSEYGKSTGIMGKPRYMAPEIVLNPGRVKPSTQTDIFSLAVVLFLLWTNNHPLEGKAAAAVSFMDAANERKLYGENPVFIFDPKDTSNRPVQGIHNGAIGAWPDLPVYLQEVFIKAFSKEAMKDPQIRVLEQEWLRTFIRMRGEIDKCQSCQTVYFADPVNPNPCPKCKKKNTYSMYIKTQRYNVPVHKLTNLYACHTVKGSDDYETQTGEVTASGKDFMLKNMTKDAWYVVDAGAQTPVAPGSSFKLKKGTTINIGVVNVEVV